MAAKGGAYARLAARSLSARGRHVKSFYTPHGGGLNFKPGSLEQRFLLMIERGLTRDPRRPFHSQDGASMNCHS